VIALLEFNMGKSAMRDTDAHASTAWKTLTQTLRLAAVAAGIGLVMAAGPVRAGDDDDEDDKTFEEKVIEGIMKGIGGTNMENQGIDYRERSPLVVPPKLDLPPPASSAEAKVPNWPKDPDEQRRKAAIQARKKANKDPIEAARILRPDELNKKGPKSSGGESVEQPGGDPGANAILSPSQLGYSGGFSGLFGGSKTESTPFKGEPTRDSLTQPPPGYQTPSPNYAYGTGPKESLNNKEYNPAAGKYGD
jgi:hypothetical protein